MKARPILFSDPMVRAILEGRKTQTRRIAKHVVAVHSQTGEPLAELDSTGPRVRCPYGQPGDRLWVREAHFINDFRGAQTPEELRADTEIVYRATDEHIIQGWEDSEGFAWRPSIHMPRWASRILLEIVSVHVECLNDISEKDSWAEGCEGFDDDVTGGKSGYQEFFELWVSINGPASWEANPWVWVVEFKKIGGAT